MLDSKDLARIHAIHALSQEYNDRVGVKHQERLLDLMKKHVVEIEELLAQRNPHGLVETGDLLILCFELLIENGRSIDEIIEICMGRYEKKLGELLA